MPPLGTKLDGEKPRCDLLPPRALLGVAQVLGYGAIKYAPDNWRRVPDARRRYVAAALRHTLAALAGEAADPESGLSHLDHAVCCLLFVSELEKTRCPLRDGCAGCQACWAIEDEEPQDEPPAPVPAVDPTAVPWAGRPQAGEGR